MAVPNQEKVDDQLRTSAKELVVLVRDGRETVTNVAVADDRREIRRRMDEVRKYIISSFPVRFLTNNINCRRS